MGGPPGELSEELVTEEKRKKGLRMSCDVGKALLILQPFGHFTYVTVHSPMGDSPGELSEEPVT